MLQGSESEEWRYIKNETLFCSLDELVISTIIIKECDNLLRSEWSVKYIRIVYQCVRTVAFFG